MCAAGGQTPIKYQCSRTVIQTYTGHVTTGESGTRAAGDAANVPSNVSVTTAARDSNDEVISGVCGARGGARLGNRAYRVLAGTRATDRSELGGPVARNRFRL